MLLYLFLSIREPRLKTIDIIFIYLFKEKDIFLLLNAPQFIQMSSSVGDIICVETQKFFFNLIYLFLEEGGERAYLT